MKRAWLLLAAICTFGLAPAATGAADKSKGVLLVANAHDTLTRQGEGYVSLLDPATGERIATIPNGGIMAHELVVTNDGKYAFAPIYGTGAVGGAGTDGSTISVLDIAARKLVGSIDLGKNVRPHFGVAGVRDGLIYVTTELEQSVTIIDPKTLKVVGSIPTGQPQSHNVVVSKDGRRAYTSNVYAGTVSVLDVPNRKLLQVIRVANKEQPATGSREQWGVQRIEMTHDDRTVLTCDWTTSDLVLIDRSTSRIRSRVKLNSPCYGMAVTADDRWVMASQFLTGELSVIDLKALKVARVIKTPPQPQEVLIRPDGKMAYVSCATDDNLALIRTSDWTVEKVVAAGNWPDGLAWGGPR